MTGDRKKIRGGQVNSLHVTAHLGLGKREFERGSQEHARNTHMDSSNLYMNNYNGLYTYIHTYKPCHSTPVAQAAKSSQED